jgi:putative transposase
MEVPKFRNRYRIASARAEWWDYGDDSAYFITICTAERKCFFGEIRNGKMILSPVGVIADLLWHQIPFHFPDWELDEFVVMPNHIHGVLIKTSDVGNDTDLGDGNPVDRVSEKIDDRDGQTGDAVQTGRAVQTSDAVQTGHALSLPSQELGPAKKYHPRLRNPGKNTLSTVIGSFKSAVTKNARRLGYEFAWQTRFHDHVIRDAGAFGRITNYIANNVANWRDDKFHG